MRMHAHCSALFLPLSRRSPPPALRRRRIIRSRPVRIVFPLAAGGGGDVFTRALADELQKAGTSRSWSRTARAAGRTSARAPASKPTPDGYTLCLMSSEPAVYNQFLYKTIPYNPEKDLQPISNLFFNTLAVVINGETKVKTFAEMLAMAKQQPGKLSYSTFSFPATVFMDRLNKAEGTDIVKVPYKGGGEVVNAVLGGTTPIAVLALSNMVPLLQTGRITPLAVVANSRSPLFPDVPMLKEVRPGEEFPTTWFGLFTQAGVPRPIVEKVAAESTASWRSRRSASACSPTAASSRPPSGSTCSPNSCATNARSRSRSSRNPARSRSDLAWRHGQCGQRTCSLMVRSGRRTASRTMAASFVSCMLPFKHAGRSNDALPSPRRAAQSCRGRRHARPVRR